MRPLLLGAAVALAGCATAPIPSATPLPATAPLPGSATLEIQVVATHDAQAPRAGVPVLVQSTELRRPVHLVSDEAGRVRLDDLPSGVYDVRAEDGGRAVAQVPPRGEAHVELRSSYTDIIVCWFGAERSLDRSLLDDDAASEFLHQPKVIHRLP